MERAPVLIVASDAMTAALLGTLVDLAGHVPHFPRPSESPVEAAVRVRPRASLVDLEDDGVAAGHALAIATACPVLHFSAARTPEDVRRLSQATGVSAFGLPLPFAEFRRLMASVVTPGLEWTASRRSAERGD